MDFLWKKEAKRTGFYVDIFKNAPVEFCDSCFDNISKYQADRECLEQKSNEKSYIFYQNGNKACENKNWMEAMKFYNATLCFAEQNSKLTSLALAGRSECFLQLKLYKKCLIDIELAKQAKYPKRLMSKLEQRHEDCLQLMEINGEFDEFVPKLSYDDDENYPGMANVLKINYNKEFGRHIIAKEDIGAGQTILVEEAFTSRIIGIQYNNCSACLKTMMNFIACEHCTNAMFCDSVCASANNFHRIECEEHSFDTKSPNEFYMRSILMAMSLFENSESLEEFVLNTVNENVKKAPEPFVDMKARYRALLQLSTFASAENKKLFFQQAFMIYNSLLMIKTVQNYFDTEQKKHFLMHLVLHHDIVISVNNFRTGDYQTTEDDGAFIICSYFNHACAPNLMVKRIGRLRYCTTTRPIKAGQQLFVTYLGDLYCEDSVKHCQDFLSRNFGFRCKCERCKPHFLSLHSRDLVSDPEFSYLCREMSKGPQNECDMDKLLHLQQKYIDFLNRYGEHWCGPELDGVIEDFETVCDHIVYVQTMLPIIKKSFNYHYLSLIVLIFSICTYFVFLFI